MVTGAQLERLTPEAIRKALDGLEGVKAADVDTVTLEAQVAQLDQYVLYRHAAAVWFH